MSKMPTYAKASASSFKSVVLPTTAGHSSAQLVKSSVNTPITGKSFSSAASVGATRYAVASAVPTFVSRNTQDLIAEILAKYPNAKYAIYGRVR